ncbi:MAG: hypothetical protein K2L23_07900 [Odoribacter sp.]|nr:hypothetical protein [Odoribacter sp.]
MKRLWLLVLFLVNIVDLNAQDIYVDGKIAQGKTAAYRCKLSGTFFLEVRNVTNTDICTEGFGGIAGPNEEALQEVLRQLLTEEEWRSIKGKNGFGLTFNLIVDNRGDLQNMVFMFRKDDPVFAKLDPDRLYQVEQKFKESLKQILSKSEKPVKSMIYIQGINYKNFK